ncbi:MAG: Fpg/Nei family DNA glycosylase [Cellulomonadaceae bacterium]|jgi:endonuclease-8|nr:Fpg/Nei family DNA glycosylase [Cellulomonadaceae bacterium]
MPEADYLRLTAQRLQAAIGGAPLQRADLRWPNIAGHNLLGRSLINTYSYGKHLFLQFDDSRSLHVHLRMEGLFRIARTGTPQARGAGHNVRAVLGTAKWTAIGSELGMLDLLDTQDEKRILQKLGPEILAPDFITNGALVAAAKLDGYKDWPICAALLEQQIVAGIGTIWMAESLWALKIHPWAKVGDIPAAQRLELLQTAHKLLVRCVEIAGLHGLGRVTRKVHGQHKRFCVRCGVSQIAVSALSGPKNSPDQGAFDRVVFWCPVCQGGY